MSAESTTPTPGSIHELQPRMELRGTVKRLELIGAFVDIGIEANALLHISQINQPNVRNVEDVLKVGDEITVYVLKVDPEAGRVALSMTQPPALTWDELKPGDSVTGTIVRIETFGVFVDIGAERPGMVHVSELTNGFVKSPSDVVKMGETVQARVLKINRKKRQIDLTMKEPEPTVEEVLDEDQEEVPTAMELALRRAMSQESQEAARNTKNRKRERSREQEDIITRALGKHQN